MKLRACNHEQELLFSLHQMGTIFDRVKMGWHCLICPNCRQRRSELAVASKALMTLRPSSMPLSVALPSTRRTRLIMCSAAIAIAAALLAYYLSAPSNALNPAAYSQDSFPVPKASHCATPIDDAASKHLKGSKEAGDKLKRRAPSTSIALPR